jgi:hypothetical protein
VSFNGTGTFVINSSGQPVVSSTVISATVFNALTADLATGLSTCITKDGQTTPTNNIPMGGFKLTNLGAATVGTDAVRLSQLQAGTAQLLAVSGTDTLTALGTPTLTAYATGNTFYFVAAATNTTSVTLNVDGLGAKAVTRHGSTALVAGDILAGEVCLVVYDGTRFQLLNPGSYTNLNVSGNLTLNAGTANGVAYLNGSKALTSGSALVFDGTNLGIGTSSPIYKLDVAGNIRALNSGADSTVIVTAPTDSYAPFISWGVSGIRNSGILGFPAGEDSLVYRSAANSFSTGTELFRITIGGNVGIGTSSPGTRLHSKSSLAENTRLEGTTARGGGNVYASFYDPTGRKGYFGYSGTDDSFNLVNEMNAYMSFGTNGNERMRLDSSGNLGIGTSSPASFGKLAVVGGNIYLDNANGALTIRNADLTNQQQVRLRMSGTDAVLDTARNSGAAPNLIFGTESTERMRLDSSGNLGIGTSSPTALLDVNADKMRLRTAKTPSSATDTGNAGDICWDSSYLYICTATNTWRRIAHATW